MIKKKMLLSLFFAIVVYTVYAAFAQSVDPADMAYYDCSTALLICSKGQYHLEEFNGPGIQEEEITSLSCLGRLGENFKESNTVWIKWEVGEDGYLEFDITPLQLQDDLDFVLFQIEKGISECNTQKPIRCVASGKNLGALTEDYQACLGPTGLRNGQSEVSEDRGCANGDDNYVAPIYVHAGESYALMIHNYTSSQGFLFNLQGSAQLKLERELTIATEHTKTDNNYDQYTFSSILDGGNILGDQQWNFGQGATPPSAQGPGPHVVQYTSSGLKQINTTIQSQQGCMLSAVTQVDALTSLNSINAVDTDLELFPNPTLDKTFLQVHTNLDQQWAQLYLLDIQGRVLHSQSEYLSNAPIEIDLSDYSPGTYLIRLETNEKTYLKKLVKQ